MHCLAPTTADLLVMLQWQQPIIRERESWTRFAAEVGLSEQFRIVNISITALRGDMHVDLRHLAKGGNFTDCLHSPFPGVHQHH